MSRYDQVIFRYDRGSEIGTVLGENPEIQGHYLVQARDCVLSISKERMFLFQAMNEWVN